MGNGYFRTSQTSTSSRQRDKRGKDSYSYQHNYVDRVRLEDTNGQQQQQQQQAHQQQQHHHHQHHSHHSKTTHDPRCPQLRAAGWRHTHKSVSHLDLATSCHGAAGAGIDHRHRQLQQQQQQQLQQHHQRLHHQSEQLSHSHSHSHLHHLQPPLTPHAQPHWTQCRVGIATAVAAGQGQLRNARSLDYTQLEREENALDIAEFYWRFDAEPQLDAVNDNFEVAAEAEATATAAAAPATSPTPTATTPIPAAAAAATSTVATASTGTAATTTVTFLDFGSESCSLRRSRSLAVIREETFSDLQIGSANSSRRRSQLIPRARLVNRGFFRESPRLLNKQQQNAAIESQQQQQQQTAEQEEAETPPDDDEDEALSQTSGATTCDSHQQQLLHLKQQQQQQLQQQHPQHHLCPQRQRQQQHQQREARDFDVYYDNLKRLDALALGLSEQLHPWHNDKSDLESLNSDYFKNSLHQSHAEQQQQHQQQQPSSLEFEALEQAVTLLSESRPRIYQSRRQQQQRHHHCLQRHIDLGAESCPEHSQSSVFPETTTSNSDDQTDSPSLSEQEYDLSHIEQIFQQGEAEEVEECYELISLTTTTRTRFESSEEEDHDERLREEAEVQSTGESLTTPTETGASDSDGTLKRAHSEPLDKLIAYDSVYLSSEDSSECTLIGESCESFEQRTSLECGEVLTISIEDTVYEPQPKQHKKAEAEQQQQQQPQQIFTQILKVEQAPSTGITSSTASKPRIQSVVEKRKLLKQEQELKQQQQVPPPLPAPPVELKRQATDSSFVVVTTTSTTHKSNLTENQYHSLPDVNIGVSLKVCENIDKELRTSYNLKRQQQRRESKRQKEGGEKGQSQQNQVTRAETYDSIRRFGRAHQKVRQREYEEREQRQRELEEALSTQGAEKETRQQPREKEKEQQQQQQQVTKLSAAIEAEVTPEAVKQEKQQQQQQHLEKQPEEVEQEQEAEEEPLPPPPPPITEEEYQDSESIAQAEQPKEAPVIEVANFSKLIERRAHEIRQRQVVLQQEQEKQQQQQELAAAFRIIVTDAQNNIIQTEAIHEEPKPVATAPISNPIQLTLRSLRRSSSSASGGKPAERRVLSTGAPIYKARPIKVLSNGDSFATRPKMSRPQILHVVDSSSSSNVGSLRRRSSARSLASNVSGEVATEYLQKVDAVKCYWNKLAGNEPEQQEATTAAEQHPNSRLHFQLGDKVSQATATPPAEKSPAQPTSSDYCSIMPPSIEIVELGDGAQKATIVSAAPPQEATEDGDEDAAQFDHIRYKVLKSQQLIRSNILTARNKKEAQFDGLIQYLQDYSFQELLSNNNVVIVEPVRTKIERPLTVVGATGGVGGASTANRTAPAKPPRQAQVTTATKKPRQRQFGAGGGGGAAAKRHFFYQPVRVNRELYEDELPDPDTVRNVRRFFEQHVLPTPGQGILVQSQQKFGGSACQLSPKSRRARGYRYLTIDTSYGGSSSVAEEQPKGMDQLLEEHKVKQHWDNASLSSGISSGDLSSPCGECHMQQESHKESPMLACKGVHVLDVVRRHNSNAANAKARAKLGQRRTWCVGQQKLEEEQQQQVDNDDEEEEDDDDDVDDEEDADVETDMCESYYVSNDVLAKIRECGSTVTYYGGRVLEPSQRSNQPQQQQQQQQQQQLINGNGIVAGGTATRTRVRQIEATCNVCCEPPPPQQDSYQGIKFKLVKSNSCSSRLELAGACGGDGDGGADALPDSNLDCELVRKMVHHFECNRSTGDGNQQQPQLTINSQSTIAAPPAAASAPLPLQELLERRQVTVNNHINVTQSEQQQQQNGQFLEPTPTTYHSQAMNIRLEMGRGTIGQQQQQNGKVCRNKNVDLAYTLAKPSKELGKSSSSGTSQGNQKSTKQYNDIPLPLPQHVEEQRQKPQPVGAVKTSTTTAEVIANREQIIVPVEIHQSQQQQQQTAQERRLSNASSSASIVDKTVVRHYVANDRSIYERRKYDDIEFEEFEVYDPAKELERQQQEEQLQQQQQQSQQQQHLQQHPVNSIDRRLTDGELYDSLDDRM